METWGKTCADCNWDAVCTHKKVLWDGKEYQYVTAICRAINGLTFVPSSLPDEPQDWYLWSTIYKRGLIIYGKEQLLPLTENDNRLVLDSPSTVSPRTTKVLPSTVDIPQRNTMARPLVGLKSVYDNEPQGQGSLF